MCFNTFTSFYYILSWFHSSQFKQNIYLRANLWFTHFILILKGTFEMCFGLDVMCCFLDSEIQTGIMAIQIFQNLKS